MSATIDNARRAKGIAKTVFSHFGEVVGVGLAPTNDGYAVKVNFGSPPSHPEDMPDTIEGVPVLVEIVGRIFKQG